MGKSVQALVAFGANLPFESALPMQTIAAASKSLAEEGLVLLALSPLYATPCFPAGAGPDYVNAAGVIDVPADLDAVSVLQRLHHIEDHFGRKREQRWGMRTLDIDLLALGDSVEPDAATQDAWRDLPPEAQRREAPDRLILPHPRLQDRAFVLVPLADVAPDWVHPRTGLSVRQMLEALPAEDRDAVKPL
jgi:2-amino-4-hydroxy-6-hydroxymethyldihydropteridine diphosphokinase